MKTVENIDLRAFEQALCEKGLQYIAGVDEAGRGPLAGPVVAAAVVLPVDFEGAGINDSKKLSPKKRESMSSYIIENALAYGFGIIEHDEVDHINILEATKKAMKDAIESVANQVRLEHVLIDAVKLEGLSVAQTAIIKGDALSLSIAAASILAKVHRDKIMEEMALKYPGYGFEKHKGYGTKAHYEAIHKLGLCPIHRRSFLRNFT